MRAFTAAFRALVSYYNELFLLAGVSLLWWITGGFFAAAALGLAWLAIGSAGADGLPVLDTSNPVWLMPLVAIPAGPAMAALANVARPVARDLHADRSMFWEGFRLYWKQALALSAISMGALSLLLLNLFFYLSRTNTFIQAFALFWAYLLIFWLGVCMYMYPVLVGLKEPGVLATLRTSIGVAFSNPLFSLLLIIIALLLTVLCVALAPLLFIAWPAVMVLLGEQGLKLFVERVRGPEEPGEDDPRRQ